jgi:hypothetical protein
MSIGKATGGANVRQGARIEFREPRMHRRNALRANDEARHQREGSAVTDTLREKPGLARIAAFGVGYRHGCF